MAKIVIKSAKFGIVVKELDTHNYNDATLLMNDLVQAIPEADWFEEKDESLGSEPRRLNLSARD